MQPSKIRAAVFTKSAALIVYIKAALAGASAIRKDITEQCNTRGASEDAQGPEGTGEIRWIRTSTSRGRER